MKEIIGDKNAFDLVRLIVHYVSTVLMAILMLATIGVYIYAFYVHWTKNFEYVLARVTEQDESVSNRISSASIIRYAIFDNNTDY